MTAACGDDGGSSLFGDVSGGGEATGGDQPGDPPPQPEDPAATFEEVITATGEATSADMSGALYFESDEMGGELASEFDLSFDDDTDVVHLEGEYSEAGEAFDVEVRSDGQTGWLRLDQPELRDVLPEGVSWLEAPYDELTETDLVSGANDTWAWLVLLRGVSEVDDQGIEEVHGTPVRMLAGEVDYEAALAAASPEEQAALDESLTITGAESVEATMLLGIDGDGRARRFEVDLDIVFEDDMGTATMGVDVAVRAFNPEVTAPEAPPAQETVPLSEVPELQGQV